MARRRIRVALPKWLKTFGDINATVAKILREAERENPAAFDFFGAGAIVRIVINKVVLPKAHQMLIKNPSLSPEEAVKKALQETTADEIRKAVQEMWPGYADADKVVTAFEAIKALLGKTAVATAA